MSSSFATRDFVCYYLILLRLIVISTLLVDVTGSADRTVKFFDLETFELIGSAGPEVSSFAAF